MRLPLVITIDGPAASGKSTLGFLLAQRLGYAFFDTGVLYRALTALALRRNTGWDETTLALLAQKVNLQVLPPTENDGRRYTLLANGEDLTNDLHAVAVDRNVSRVASLPAVRTALKAQQRRIGLGGQIVMVGRDVGAVIMPDADLKIFLRASLAARAARRHAELLARGETLPLETVQADLGQRDAIDAANTFQPAEAWMLDTDTVSPTQEAQTIIDWIEQGTWQPTGTT